MELMLHQKSEVVADVNIGVLRGSYGKDFEAADRMAGITEAQRKALGLTWHHHEDLGRMQLIRTSVHGAEQHSGQVAAWQSTFGLGSKDYPR